MDGHRYYKFTISEFELWVSGCEFGTARKFIAEHTGSDEDIDDPIWDQIFESDTRQPNAFLKFNTKMTCLECKPLPKPVIMHARSSRAVSVMQIPVQVARIIEVYSDADGNEMSSLVAEGVRNNSACNFYFRDACYDHPNLMQDPPSNFDPDEFYFSAPLDFENICDLMIVEGVL